MKTTFLIFVGVLITFGSVLSLYNNDVLAKENRRLTNLAADLRDQQKHPDVSVSATPQKEVFYRIVAAVTSNDSRTKLILLRKESDGQLLMLEDSSVEQPFNNWLLNTLIQWTTVDGRQYIATYGIGEEPRNTPEHFAQVTEGLAKASFSPGRGYGAPPRQIRRPRCQF